MKQITIYIDGASRGNPGLGGWGVVLIYGKHQKTLKGFAPEVTNNQMELTAAIKAFEQLKEPCDITVFTDSKYVIQGITEWLSNWKINAWKNSAKKPVKNKELWQQLDYIIQRHKIKWRWVKGHSGDAGNELADSLANQAIDERE